MNVDPSRRPKEPHRHRHPDILAPFAWGSCRRCHDPPDEHPRLDERPDTDREVTLLGEVLSLAPRLASRTIAQIQASQQLMAMLRCAGTSPADHLVAADVARDPSST